MCGTTTWDPNTAGGHAVVLYGYDDSDGSWLLLNSWGTTTKRPNGLWRAPQALNYDCTYPNGGGGIYALGLASFDVTFGNTSPVSNPGGPYVAECQGSLTHMPLNGSSSFQPGGSTLTYAWTTTCPGASFDNPSSATPVLSVASSSCGVVNCDVTLTVTDTAGAKDSATANVIIHDTEPPNITCPAHVSQCTDPGQCSALVHYSLPNATDNCAGPITIVCHPPPGSSFNVGDTTVNCTATDCSLNQSSCSFTVTVIDCEPPMITCPSSVTQCTDLGLCSAVVNGINPVVSENCPGVSLSYTLTGATTGNGSGSASGQTFNKGDTLVTYFATDTSHNTKSCNFTVTVKDCEPPKVTCSVASSTLWPANHDLINVGFLAQAVDNCDGPIPAANIKVQVFSDEDELAPGSGNFSPDAKNLTATGTLRLRAESSGSGDGRVYLIVAKATDSSGNTGFCTSTVTVTHDQSAKSIASVGAQAAAAQDYASAHNGAPLPGYFVIGNGPVVGPKQ